MPFPQKFIDSRVIAVAAVALVMSPLAAQTGQRSQTPSVAAIVRQADALYSQRKYAEAYAAYQRAAKLGNASSGNWVGFMLQKGQGTTQNYGQAIAWYEWASARGNYTAEWNLGWMHEYGLGVPKDPGAALWTIQDAAFHGSLEAQDELGYMYMVGSGTSVDYRQAMFWSWQAATQGRPNAQDRVGYMYESGLYVAKNSAQARVWYQKAASQGQQDAANHLAQMNAAQATAPATQAAQATQAPARRRTLDLPDRSDLLERYEVDNQDYLPAGSNVIPTSPPSAPSTYQAPPQAPKGSAGTAW